MGRVREDFDVIKAADGRLVRVQIHALGINVHCDVKPHNLMLRQDGPVALIDFDIAKHADHALGHTMHDKIVGSPYYPTAALQQMA